MIAKLLLILLLAVAPTPGTLAEFGAIPNDGIDDTEAIQRAVDAGNVIEFDSGIYDVDAVNVSHDGRSFVGQPGTILRRIDRARPRMFNVRSGVSGISWTDIEFDGNESNQIPANYMAVIRTTDVSDIRIRSCVFRRGGNRAVDIRAGSQIWITESQFIDCGTNNPNRNGGNAISVDRHGDLFPAHVWVLNNYFRGFGDTAIGIPTSDFVTVTGNQIFGEPDGGMRTESGISLKGSTHVTCSFNVVQDCRSGHGIGIWDKPGRPSIGQTCTGNILRNCHLYLRFFEPESFGNTVTGNVLENGLINITGNAGSHTTVTGNVLNGLGIRMTGRGGLHHVITGNSVTAPVPLEKQRFVQDGLIEDNLLIETAVSPAPEDKQ